MAVNNEFNEDFNENDLYEQRRQEENEKRINELQDEIDKIKKKDLHSTIKRWDKRGNLTEYLDNHIEQIEDMLFQCDSPKVIADTFNVPQYKMFLWSKETKHKKRIEIALEFSAEMRMHKSQEVLEKYLKDPRLSMQQAGLVRELALHHSRMAGFRQPRVFGKAPEPPSKAPTVNIVSSDDMNKLVEAIRQKRIEGNNTEEADAEVI